MEHRRVQGTKGHSVIAKGSEGPGGAKGVHRTIAYDGWAGSCPYAHAARAGSSGPTAGQEVLRGETYGPTKRCVACVNLFLGGKAAVAHSGLRAKMFEEILGKDEDGKCCLEMYRLRQGADGTEAGSSAQASKQGPASSSQDDDWSTLAGKIKSKRTAADAASSAPAVVKQAKVPDAGSSAPAAMQPRSSDAGSSVPAPKTN